MSQEKEESKVLITDEDVKNIRDFFSHFNITMPVYLTDHLNTLENAKPITEENQSTLKTLIARTILESEHEIFKDSLFEEVVPNCQKEWFDSQFKKDFEDAMDDPSPQGSSS